MDRALEALAQHIDLGVLALLLGIFTALVLAAGYGLSRAVFWWRRRATATSGPRLDALYTGGHGEMANFICVSRHAIAEEGLTCPRCDTCAAEPGDYTAVAMGSVGGRKQECVKCPGFLDETKSKPCRQWLLASPTTEHGDHLAADGTVRTDDPDEHYLFRRQSADGAVKDLWGADVSASKVRGEMTVTGIPSTPADKPPLTGTI